MKQLKTIFQGISISCTLYIFFGIIFTTGEIRNNMIGIILLGTAIGILSLIYEFEKINILFKTIIHLLGSFLSFLIIANYLKWFEFKIGIIIFEIIMFIIIFFLIWTYFYFKEKKEFKKINTRLKNEQSRKETS